MHLSGSEFIAISSMCGPVVGGGAASLRLPASPVRQQNSPSPSTALGALVAECKLCSDSRMHAN